MDYVEARSSEFREAEIESDEGRKKGTNQEEVKQLEKLKRGEERVRDEGGRERERRRRKRLQKPTGQRNRSMDPESAASCSPAL